MTTVSGPPAACGPPRRLRAAARMAAIVAIVAGSAAAVYAERSTISSGLAALRHSNLGWVVAGFGAECLSMAAFALLQQRLLRVAGARLTFGSLLAIAYTSNAVTLAVPVAGSGMAAAYAQRQFRGRGADTATVGLALLIAGVVSTVAFAVIAAVGAILSGSPADAVLGLLTSACCAAAAGLIVVVLHSPRGRTRLRPPVAVLIRLSQRLVHRPAGDPATIAAGVLRRLGSFHLGPLATAAVFGYALVNWAADAACLAAAIAAIGVAVPWDKLLLVWSAGTAAASFSPTPYGLGVVDIALIAVLTRAGLASPDAVGAVLLYRIITFKILVTFGWIGYRRVQDRTRQAVR
ncbi:MAG TPA: lysylphosphatidylglycerol synthase transmembrane domain-containing protein [Streptosporangiaceae bacterium]